MTLDRATVTTEHQ